MSFSKDISDLVNDVAKTLRTSAQGIGLNQQGWVEFHNEIQQYLLALDSSPSLKEKFQGLERSVGSLRGKEHSKDIDEFGEVLAKVFEFYQSVEAPREDRDKIEVRMNSVDKELKGPTLTWSLISRNPGQFSRGPAGQGSIKEYSPHLRGVFTDPERPNQEIHAYGRRFDNEICLEFTCFDSNYFQKQMILIESVVERYKWFFAYKGFWKLTWLRRGSDSFREVGADKLYCGKIYYQVQTEKIELVTENILTDLVFQLYIYDKIPK